MANGLLKSLTQVNTKQQVDFLLYQCDRCASFFATSSAMFGSILDNAILISWIASNRFQAFGLMASSTKRSNSHSYIIGIGISTVKAIFEMLVCAISIQDFSLNKLLAFPSSAKSINCNWSKLYCEGRSPTIVPKGLFTKRQYLWKSFKSGKYCQISSQEWKNVVSWAQKLSCRFHGKLCLLKVGLER